MCCFEGLHWCGVGGCGGGGNIIYCYDLSKIYHHELSEISVCNCKSLQMLIDFTKK